MLSYECLYSLQANEINFHFAIIFPGKKSESQYFFEGELFQARFVSLAMHTWRDEVS